MSILQELEASALNIIQEAFDNHDRLSVMCSFGKDSSVLLDLALKVDPNMLVVFNNTTNEHPQTLSLMKQVVQSKQLNFVMIKSLLDFWEIVDAVGMPNRDNRVCCDFLKMKGVNRFISDSNMEAQLLGVRREESFYRRNIKYKGIDDRTRIWKYNPLYNWSEKNIYEYIIVNNVPLNSIYSLGHDRCGCQCCSLDMNHFDMSLLSEESFDKMTNALSKDPSFAYNNNTQKWVFKENIPVTNQSNVIEKLNEEYFIRFYDNPYIYEISDWFDKDKFPNLYKHSTPLSF